MKPGQEEQIMERTKHEVFEILRKSVRPEFLNRVDEVIMFTPLTKSDIKSIVKLQLRLLGDRLAKAELKLVATDDVIQYLADKGFDPQFGARPVKRAIQKDVLNELSKYLLGSSVDRTQPIVLDVFDGQIVFRKKVGEEVLFEV
jgi:ATP-dependent Clp protease ATP-binding subunit ClpB